MTQPNTKLSSMISQSNQDPVVPYQSPRCSFSFCKLFRIFSVKLCSVFSGRKSRFFSSFKKKNLLLLLCITIFLFFSIFSILTIKVMASNRSNMPEKLVTRIQIQPGDTLWKIASAYHSEEYISIDEYITEIQKCNGIHTDNIRAGQSLIIPYYID